MLFKIINQIRIESTYSLWNAWKKFVAQGENGVNLELRISSHISYEYGVDILEPQPGPAVLKCRNALLSANEDWTKACVTLLDGEKDGLEGAVIAAIMTHLSTRHGLMAHASLVDARGRGILFVGPSGIGKTTQAELWQKYRDAVIINGDMALLHEENGVFSGHGCPWHGSSPYCENREVPLSGIIILEQAKENTIERMQGFPLVERIMHNIFLPKWYEDGMEAAMETLDHLLSEVPVYLLKCRPDEGAVELVESVLWKND